MLEMERLTPKFENDYPNRQTIDRNTGVFLRGEGSVNYPGIRKFSLHGFGDPIHFQAHFKLIEQEGKKPKLEWRVLSTRLPKELEDRRAEIEECMERALETHGSSYRNERYHEVTAEVVKPEMPRLTPQFENDYANRQTIDRSTGAYLVFEGGTMERGVLRFSFHIEGEKIDFYAIDRKQDCDSYDPSRPSIHWEYGQISVPQHMLDRRDEIIAMIGEALKAHGFAYKRQCYVDVTAEYMPPNIPDI